MIPMEKRIVCLGILVAAMVGLDVKALRTQPQEIATKHLRHRLQTFLRLVAVVRFADQVKMNEMIAARDDEELDLYIIINSLMGVR
jgi:xylose isomerase